MTRPTFAQWRTTANPINPNPSTGVTVNAQQVNERLLAALASFVVRTNPDGTTF